MDGKNTAMNAMCMVALAMSPFLVGFVSVDDLSPERWPADDRVAAEEAEFETWAPEASKVASGHDGVISATAYSPVSVEAGLQALRAGGTAADAAATVALTQVTRELGSVVSYAGIMTALYYDASTETVHSIDGGYNSYKGEVDPESIPIADLGPYNFDRKPTIGGAKGRETLVPGFMAGIQAMHERFGKLPFKSLFEPALYYATNGVRISPILAAFFAMREGFLSKTAEGRRFLRQAGGDLPTVGDNFVQSDLANTLTGVASHGSSYMYTGPWSQAFVKAVQQAGGKATPADLAAYRPIWSKPYVKEVFGHEVYVNGSPNLSVYQILTGLKIAEALGLDKGGPYWNDPKTLRDLSRIGELLASAPYYSLPMIDLLRTNGIDTTPEALRDDAFAHAVAPMLGDVFATSSREDRHHSNSIVVVDKSGNVAVLTHSINGVLWGDTGMVVGGIPLPDSAGFQQSRLAAIKPGDRLPNEIACTLTFAGNKPVLATAPIGTSMLPETLKVIVSVIAHKQDLETVLSAPPLLMNHNDIDKPVGARAVNVPAGAYGSFFLHRLRALGAAVQEVPIDIAENLRGTLASAAIDIETSLVTAPAVENVMVFSAAASDVAAD